MEREEMIVLDEGVDDFVDTDFLCCFGIYVPFRS